MAEQLILPQALDSNGDPISGAKANVYETGTTTPVTVHQDTGLSTPHANPIVADSEGRFAQAFYNGALTLKVVFTDASDVEYETIDPAQVLSISASAADDVTFSPVTGNSATDVQTAVANNTAAIQSKTGADANYVTGTAGVDGNLVKWNADGDAVDSGFSVLDEDDFSSDSATAAPTQQSSKAYVDARSITQTDGSNGYYGVRAFARVDGTGTPSFIRNVGFASITDNGTGDYTLTLTAAMPDTDFAVIVTNNTSGTQFGNARAITTTTIGITLAGSGGGAIDGTFSVLILD